MEWSEIENVMHTLEKPAGGFTIAHRGIVTLPDGKRLFIKIGIDDESKRWIQKEIVVYMFLRRHEFPFVPKFLTCNEDRTGFALEALLPSDGWDWTEQWAEDRLAATRNAMDELAKIIPSEQEKEMFGPKGITPETDGWQILKASPDKQDVLRTKLRTSSDPVLAQKLDFDAMAEQSARYLFKDDVVVHQDVRADNCAWNAEQEQVKLIDWSWTQVGDRSIDTNAMLVHVYKTGLNVLEYQARSLDSSALQWLAGFWLNASTGPLRTTSPSNEPLRAYQLESGITALQLAEKVAK